MYATNYFEENVLKTFTGTTFVAPGTVYLALFQSNPTDTGTGGIEINYNGYSRMPVDFTIPYAESGGIGIKNSVDLVFAESQTDAGTSTHIGIYDSATIGSGNMLLYGELTTPIQIKTGQQPIITAGDLLYYSTGNFSTYFKTAMLNVLRGKSLPQFTPYLALFDGNPNTTGNELATGNYSRVTMNFSNPSEQSGGQRQISNTTETTFPVPTGTWGLWAYDGIKDAATGGNLIVFSENPTAEQITKSVTPSVPVNGYKILLN